MEPRIELLPGLYLRAIQTDKFKTGCMSINFVRPLTAREAPHAALLPAVLLRGTEHYPDIRSISSFLDDHYGASVGTLVRKKGEVLTTGFFADFLEETFLPEGEQTFLPVLDFVAELLLHPQMRSGGFVPEAVEGEKRNLLDTIDWRINDKRSYAVSQMLATMCRDEAYGIPRLGTRPEAEAITGASLLAYYRHLLAHSRVELFYMGRRSPAQVAEAVRSRFAALPRGPLDPVGTRVVADVAEVRTVEERLDVSQGKLCIGLRTGIAANAPEFPALMLLNAVYGAGATGKLFLHVREKLSLCYYANSSIDKSKGLMIVSSGIETQNYAIAKAEILRQLEACQSGQITADELEAARLAILSALRASLDSPGRMDEYMLGCALDGSETSVEDLMAQIARVTLPEVCAVAQRVRLDTVYFLKGASE